MATKTKTLIVVGDKVRVFAKKYVRGTRRPGFKGRFNKSFQGVGVLIAKTDPRGHSGTATASWTEEQIRHHFATHVGLINATGYSVVGDVTEKNNPVLMPDGRVIWLDADAIQRVS